MRDQYKKKGFLMEKDRRTAAQSTGRDSATSALPASPPAPPGSGRRQNQREGPPEDDLIERVAKLTADITEHFQRMEKR